MHGYMFPNEAEVAWTLMIVLYPYITGLVAGAFIVSSMYHVFDVKSVRPVAKFSLASALAFLLFATLPLLNHLGHPERALNIVITPNFSSAMAGFGLLYTSYLIILVLETWLVFRQEIVMGARRSRGVLRVVYKALALWVYDISEETLARDKKVIRVLAAIGVPAAVALHGYVGFLFGAIKANPWWSTPLMPLIFLISAAVSGVAVLILMYQIAMKLRGESTDPDCMRTLVRYLWYFLIIAIVLETLELITLAYEGAEEWAVIKPLLLDKLAVSFIGVQLILGSLIPLTLLSLAVMIDVRDHTRSVLAFISSSLLMIEVFAMRWNVVIGGQMFSKSFEGYREAFSPGFMTKEGIAPAIFIMILPFVFIAIFNWFVPFFAPRAKTT